MKGRKSIRPILLVLLAIIGTAVMAQDEVATPSETPAAISQVEGVGAQPEAMPSLTESVLPSLSRIAISLCVIVAIIYLTVFLLRKLSGNRIGGKKGSTIQVLEQTYLGPKKSVCLLKLADRAILVGITETNINLLTELDWESVPEEITVRNERKQTGFPGFLNDAAGKFFGGGRSKGVERESVV